MISAKRRDELYDNWRDETDDDEWRDELTDEEQAMVDEWDAEYTAGMIRISQAILNLEGQNGRL